MNLSNLVCPPEAAVSLHARLAQSMMECMMTGRNTDERFNIHTRVPRLALSERSERKWLRLELQRLCRATGSS